VFPVTGRDEGRAATPEQHTGNRQGSERQQSDTKRANRTSWHGRTEQGTHQ
jgi:hypothetical protein